MQKLLTGGYHLDLLPTSQPCIKLNLLKHVNRISISILGMKGLQSGTVQHGLPPV